MCSGCWKDGIISEEMDEWQKWSQVMELKINEVCSSYDNTSRLLQFITWKPPPHVMHICAFAMHCKMNIFLFPYMCACWGGDGSLSVLFSHLLFPGFLCVSQYHHILVGGEINAGDNIVQSCLSFQPAMRIEQTDLVKSSGGSGDPLALEYARVFKKWSGY